MVSGDSSGTARRPASWCWGVLGSSSAMDAWVDWLSQQPDQRVVARWSGASEKNAGSVSELTSWTDLLGHSSVNVVAVAAGAFPERATALRQLIDYGMPLVLEVPDFDPIFDCELAMIQAERKAVLAPYFPAALHPWVAQLRDWIADPSRSPVGAIDQVSIERIGMPEGRRTAVDAFAGDAIILRRLLGQFRQLQAMEGAGEGRGEMASVHVRSAMGPMARWSLISADAASTGRLVARGTEGSLRIDMQQRLSDWTAGVEWYRSVDAERSRTVDWAKVDGWSGHLASWEQVQSALAGRTIDFTWEDAYRSAELADLMELSGRRGKTLDIHNQQVTERETFKGIMSAVGCLLLLATPVLLVLGMVLQSVFAPFAAHPIWRLWPVMILLPLLIFLLAQALQLVFPSRNSSKP